MASGVSQARVRPSSSEALEDQYEADANTINPVEPQRELRRFRPPKDRQVGHNQIPNCQAPKLEQQEMGLTTSVDSIASQQARQETAGPPGRSSKTNFYVSAVKMQKIEQENEQLRKENAQLLYHRPFYEQNHISRHGEERKGGITDARLTSRPVDHETTLQNTFTTLNTENRALAQEKSKLASALSSTEAKVQRLQRSLEECKERIFRMQPLEHTTDAKLACQYRSLCDAIEDWVDCHFGDSSNLFAEGFDRQGEQDSYGLFKTCLCSGEMKTAIQHPSACLVMLRLLIFRHLHFYLLNKHRVCAGLCEMHEGFLLSIDVEMEKLEPPRDEVSMSAWKADVQRAMRRLKFIQLGRLQYLHKVNQEIGYILNKLVSWEQRSDYQVNNFQKLSIECEDLAANVRLSNVTYEFVFDFHADSPAEERILYAKDLDHYRIIDEASGQPIRGANSVQVGVHERVGEKLCVVHPAMIRRGTPKENDLTLVVATILVKLDMPALRRGKMKAVE